ncbi:MAG: asparagine synthase (glutamine-hydrolyzing) [Acidobacteriaceae bacterium]|nr:asparagine synthase (glutamine-hydrolyzing) [Acidobacteriaceae bacterium]MBV8570984.1 asparagine synthase (glutamine-hydrolyzing) [Acidobacteriaceae bacterium]
MCGIAGLVGLESSRRPGSVRAMVSSLERRGPDAEGLEIWNGATLGHRRLAIFDLTEAGGQPMATRDGKVAVVFNGAIYNFRELRGELQSYHHCFRSNSDTEVLLHGYRQWGIAGLVSRLHGMFAFGLWDSDTGSLHLVRDRLGVKPLYYVQLANGSVGFASSARALRAAGLASELDADAVAEFLEFGYVTENRCIYRGVHKVLPAHIVSWSHGVIRHSQYWAPHTGNNFNAISFDDAVEQTENLLLKAVEMRLFADVPVGALLSGGVDSSLVCWAAARLGGNLTAYTISTPGDPADESDDAIKTAHALGIPHKVLPIHPEQIPGIDELTSAYGEPFACSSGLGMLQLSRAIKPEATVLLTGDGGDDVYLGYPEHKHLWMAQRIAAFIPPTFAKSWYGLRHAALRFSTLRRPAHFLDYATGGLAAFTAAHDGWPKYQREGLLGERLADVQLGQRGMRWSPENGRQVLTDMLVYDREGRFVSEYLTKVDGSTMHYAIEARSPFLDQNIWEFASALPYSVRLQGGRLKAVLRELARRHLGARVAYGRKRGFTIPVQRWLTGAWLDSTREAFRDSLLQQEGWIRSDAALKCLTEATKHKWAPLQLWYIYVLENWLRHEKTAAVTTEPEVKRKAFARAVAS